MAFLFYSILVFMAQWVRLGGGVVHPLMRRYVIVDEVSNGFIYKEWKTTSSIRRYCIQQIWSGIRKNSWKQGIWY
ncbi:hypothetical protein EH291_18940 [Vibrio cholerae]|nr:hypothetical protein [Vibrio cholerae]